MRTIRTTAIAMLTATALLTSGQAFAQETTTETAATETTMSSTGSNNDGKTEDNKGDNKKDDSNKKDDKSSGSSSDDKNDKGSTPDSNSGSVEINDKGSLIRLGSMTTDHFKIATAVVSLLSAIAGALVVVFKFIPGAKDLLRR
ncbi:hypothetical protein CMUST_10475 [Corynebacterium mustelae]|uniref:Uncharacterized protein n=1 Tax=Corynebacterium mustelae TaxID=571915 RepID=A0A0G3GZ26_9CORY|nr:hypothetical protein [Corynebacterium mustelae]AKK06411.1 hypothetical protein CMUST_10475 [Corynebacterium mustelae]